MIKVHYLGDSICYYSFPYLSKMLENRVYITRKGMEVTELTDMNAVSAVNGGDSASVRAYLSSFQGRFDFDLLMLNCGLHDIKTVDGKRQQSEANYEENLIAVLSMLKAAGKPVLWVRSTPVIDHIHNERNPEFLRFSDDLIRYNNIADRIMRENGIPTIDLYSFTKQLGGEDIFRDHVHYREDICRLQAAYLAGSLSVHLENLAR